jgi:hypothetical protein
MMSAALNPPLRKTQGRGTHNFGTGDAGTVHNRRGAYSVQHYKWRGRQLSDVDSSVGAGRSRRCESRALIMEGRRFSICKFFENTTVAAVRSTLAALEAGIHSWSATDPNFRYATQLASQWQGPSGSQRLSVLVKTTEGQYRWYVRVLCTRVPHLAAAVEYSDTETYDVKRLPSIDLAEFLLRNGTVDVVFPEPGGTSRGFTAPMYIRYKLRMIPGGRELLDTPVGAGARPWSGQLLQTAREVFTNAERQRSIISTSSSEVRRFLKDCDQMLLKEARSEAFSGVARMSISPDLWFNVD